MPVRPPFPTLLLPVLLLGSCVLGRDPEPKAPPATWTTSPNGEPLPFGAGQDDCRAALAAWFGRVDGNGDGRIEPDEMLADASRWFALADLDHDGQITPDELASVRARLLPQAAPDAEAEPEPGPARRPRVPRPQARLDPVMQADANADFRVGAAEFRAWVLDRVGGRSLDRSQVLESCAKAQP